MVKKKVIKKKAKRKSNDLTIHFMARSEIAGEDTVGKIKKIMGIVLKNKIIILQGKLDADEEAKLIENSMMLIGNVKGFAGIEIASLSGENENRGLFDLGTRNSPGRSRPRLASPSCSDRRLRHIQAMRLLVRRLCLACTPPSLDPNTRPGSI